MNGKKVEIKIIWVHAARVRKRKKESWGIPNDFMIFIYKYDWERKTQERNTISLL